MNHYKTIRNLSFLIFLSLSTLAFADPVSLRWTANEDVDADFEHIVSVIRSKTNFSLRSSDFQLLEDRDLAHQHFRMYVQLQDKLPIQNMSIRTWTDLDTGKVVQVEAFLEKPRTRLSFFSNFMNNISGNSINSLRSKLTSQDTMNLVRNYIQNHSEDSQINSIQWKDMWSNGELVRMVQTKTKHGKHRTKISITSQEVIDSTFEEFPQIDVLGAAQEFSIPALVFPIYEEVEGTSESTPRIPAELKYLKSTVARVNSDPYTSLKSRRYTEDKYDPVLGMTEIGRANGYWSMASIREEAAKIRSELPVSPNTAEAGGIILNGRYATVSIHPDAMKLKDLTFTPQLSTQYFPDWKPSELGVYEMVPTLALLGKPLTSYDEAWNRVARRLPNHDPAQYLNDGFDEIQVYYAINTLFDSLHQNGFTDPELSTRPFNAFLYNPDISMRNNAFYTDDTINFTTYSSTASNYARDNPTIWHELGHGVMDRLMGDEIQLADTGGLSEGMADFIAALVINDVSQGNAFPGSNHFRIINKTGFFLTNEVHDDGEAYGGAMKDLLDLAIAKFGREGLRKVTDLTLETMRLTRNHPHLTAQDWFNHMLFADQLGNADVRSKGELQDVILSSISDRNFSLNGASVASLTLKNDDNEVQSKGPGSRGSPIPVRLAPEQTATYHLSVSVRDGEMYKFKFPVQVKVEFNKGALQGAVHWKEKENGPLLFTLNSPGEIKNFDLSVTGKCDEVNREDGSCVDYAYVQIWNQGETEKPQAKKRFYVRVRPNQTSEVF